MSIFGSHPDWDSGSGPDLPRQSSALSKCSHVNYSRSHFNKYLILDHTHAAATVVVRRYRLRVGAVRQRIRMTRPTYITPAIKIDASVAVSFALRHSGVASYGALGHVPLLDFQQFQFLFTME